MISRYTELGTGLMAFSGEPSIMIVSPPGFLSGNLLLVLGAALLVLTSDMYKAGQCH